MWALRAIQLIHQGSLPAYNKMGLAIALRPGKEQASMPTASKTETNENTDADSGLGPVESGTPRGDLHIASRGDSSRAQALEARTQEIGRELFERIGRGPALAARLVGRPVHAATLDDPLVRVQLFRFIDALPALKTPDSVRRHLAEYLAEAGDRVPWWLEPGPAAGARGLDRGRNGWPRRRGRRPA